MYVHFQKRKIEIEPGAGEDKFYLIAPGRVTLNKSAPRMIEIWKYKITWLFRRILSKYKQIKSELET